MCAAVALPQEEVHSVMNIRERIENNLVIVFLATLLTGFLAGIGAYEAILNIAHLKVISEAQYAQCQGRSALPPGAPSPGGPSTIYADTEADTHVHNIRFLDLTASSVRNPPRVHDRIWVAFTLQNVGPLPIRVLGTYVTAYDPTGANKDFAFSHKNTTIKPQEIVTTSGSLIVDVPGTWELGPHYALGEHWDSAQYPGHWKRFQLPVVQTQP